MKVVQTDIPGLLIIEPRVIGDPRGYFSESYHARRYAGIGLPTFVQDNVSFSRRGVLRGLHFQNPNPQGKLVQVLHGEVWDVAVDLRRASPTFGNWFGINLSATDHRQLYVPPGFAHGFCVVSDEALFAYKCTDFHNPETEMRLRWDDRDLAIAWPTAVPTLSEQDSKAAFLKELSEERLVPFRGNSA